MVPPIVSKVVVDGSIVILVGIGGAGGLEGGGEEGWDDFVGLVLPPQLSINIAMTK